MVLFTKFSTEIQPIYLKYFEAIATTKIQSMYWIFEAIATTNLLSVDRNGKSTQYFLIG